MSISIVCPFIFLVLAVVAVVVVAFFQSIDSKRDKFTVADRRIEECNHLTHESNTKHFKGVTPMRRSDHSRGLNRISPEN